MPRVSPSYQRTSVASSTGAISENAIVFQSSGGHTHDGLNSSLIDTTKYSIWDFSVNTVYSTTPRASRQDRNIEQFKNFIVNVVNNSVLEPAGVILGENVVNATNIVSGSISSDLIAANTITANNIAANSITTDLLATDSIKSLNYNYVSGVYSSAGSFLDLSNGEFITPGLRLYSNGVLYISNTVVIGGTSASTVVSGAAAGANAIPTGGAASDVNSNVTTINGGKIRTGEIESTGFVRGSNATYSTTGTRFDLDSGDIIAPNFRLFSNGVIYAQSGVFSGTVNASGGTFTGKITAGLTEVGTDIRGVTDYAGIALRNDSWENAWVRRSNNTVYFRAGSSTKYIQVDTSGTTTIQFPNFSVDNSGNVVASNVSITGGTLDIGGSDSSSFHVSSSGSHWAGSGTYSSAPFRVSSTGDLTASSVAITGGTLDIGGSDSTSFHVASNGAHWSGSSAYSTAPFRVSSGGSLVASSVAITGGTLDIGGSDSTSFHVASNGAHWAGNSSYSSAPFRVSSSGALVASSATITGEINATSGNFSGNLTSNAVISGGEFASGTFSLSSGSSTNIRFGTSYGAGIDINGGSAGSIYVGFGIVGGEGNRYNVPDSYGYHVFSGRAQFNRTTYGTSWNDQQVVAKNDSGNAGMAIRASNDAGTVQLRVGAGATVLYVRNYNDSSDADMQVGNINSSKTYNRAVSGRDVYVDSGGSIGYLSSSITMKKNIKSINYGLSDVLKIRPVSFEYTYSPDGVTNIGMIAEELKEIVPEACVFDDDDPGSKPSINYSQLTPVLVKAIQELKAEVDSLKEEISNFSN